MRGLRAVVRGNVLWLGVVSLLNDTASEMIFPLLPVFLVQVLGAGPAFLGLVEGVAESTASLVKLGGGWISDRLGRRKALVGWGYGIAGAVRPLVALATAPWQVLAVRFTDRLGKGVRTAPRDALLAESAPPDRRGAAFGFHRAADHVGAVLGPLLAAGLLLAYPGRLRWVFALSAVPSVLAVWLVVWRVREQAGPAARVEGGAARGVGEDRGVGAAGAVGGGEDRSEPPLPGAAGAVRGAARVLEPRFRSFLGVVLLFTLGNASDAFLLLRAEQLGVSVALLPILWGALHVSKSLWSVPGGVLADRVGSGRVVVGGWIVYAAVYAGFALAGAEWHAWALFLAYGLFFGLTEAPEKALVASLAVGGRRGTAFGVYHLVIGLAAFPSSVVFGAIWEAFGARVAFLAGAAVALLAAGLLPLALRAGRGGDGVRGAA
ncbi:MAG TPA: MFS transporter [Longimicrobiales bacterium]